MTQGIFSTSLSLALSLRQLTVLGLIIVTGASACAADPPERLDLGISEPGLQRSDGQLVAPRFRGGDDIDAAPRLQQVNAIVDRQAVRVFPGVEAGRYAAIVSHDIDDIR